jgi:predicted RNase H-like nuclease
MAKDKKDFLGALREVKNLKEQVSETKQYVVQEAREKKIMGRPSHKKQGVEYAKITAYIEKENKEKLQLLMLTKYKDKFVSLEELLDFMVAEFLKNEK